MEYAEKNYEKSAMEKLSNCENISYEFVGNVDNYIIMNAYEEYRWIVS